MKSKKISLYLLSFVSMLLLMCCTAVTVKADSTVLNGVPNVLQGKYWQTTINKRSNGNSRHSYFYPQKDGYVLKHTEDGTLKAKWMMYNYINGTYILNGANCSDVKKAIWIFITPKNNWQQIKIGYTITDISGRPDHLPKYYQHEIATKVSEVTAILH